MDGTKVRTWKWLWLISKYYHEISLGRQRKITKNLSQDSQYFGSDSNRVYPESKSRPYRYTTLLCQPTYE
jgi:hypothetical protein